MCIGGQKNIIDPAGGILRKVVGQEQGDKLDPIGGIVHKKKKPEAPVMTATSLIDTPAPQKTSSGGTVILG